MEGVLQNFVLAVLCSFEGAAWTVIASLFFISTGYLAMSRVLGLPLLEATLNLTSMRPLLLAGHIESRDLLVTG